MDVDSSDLYPSSMFICHLSRKISLVESYRRALLDEPYKTVFSLPFSKSRISNICKAEAIVFNLCEPRLIT